MRPNAFRNWPPPVRVPVKRYVGVDGCHDGWIAVIKDEKRGLRTALYRNINDLWEANKNATLILIDIPIGLPDKDPGERLCDTEARKLIGSRRSSVFPVPCREAVYTYDGTASEINERKTGRRLPKQSLAIIPKIRQVDLLLSANKEARTRVRETHPELCFTGLNNGQPMRYAKKKVNGFGERLELLSHFNPDSAKLVENALAEYRDKDAARDDIVDALALCIVASIEESLTVIPSEPRTDASRLPMQMVYYLKKD